jgi:hypothetical protein
VLILVLLLVSSLQFQVLPCRAACPLVEEILLIDVAMSYRESSEGSLLGLVLLSMKFEEGSFEKS